MEDEIEVLCPYCGEPGSVSVTPGEEDDSFVQDCAVCCRPWTVTVHVGYDGEVTFEVGRG